MLKAAAIRKFISKAGQTDSSDFIRLNVYVSDIVPSKSAISPYSHCGTLSFGQ